MKIKQFLFVISILFSFQVFSEEKPKEQPKEVSWKHLYKCYYDSQLLCQSLAGECFTQLQGTVQFYLASQCYISYVQCLNDTKAKCEKKE